jgi:subtilase family serine protease
MKNSLLALPLLPFILLIAFNTTNAFAYPLVSNQHANISSSSVTAYKTVQACNQTAPGFARCLAIVRKPIGIHPSTAVPPGLTPSNLLQAYKLPSSATGKGQIIAVIDAYDDPNAEKDMAIYRAMFHIASCTTANGCFKKVDQNGSAHYPTPDSGWAGETALDLDMISAIAPSSHILLIEATSASYNNLGLAVNTAVHMGAKIITNSYGGQEDRQSVNTMAHYYNHPGVTIVASAGDSGYSVQLPAA